jgi:hypothetical protein
MTPRPMSYRDAQTPPLQGSLTLVSLQGPSDVLSGHPTTVQLSRRRRQTVEQRSIDDPNERRPYAAHGHMDVVT